MHGGTTSGVVDFIMLATNFIVVIRTTAWCDVDTLSTEKVTDGQKNAVQIWIIIQWLSKRNVVVGNHNCDS